MTLSSRGRNAAEYSLKAPCDPLSIEFGTYKTVKARFWSWLSGKSPQTLLSCSLSARKRTQSFDCDTSQTASERRRKN